MIRNNKTNIYVLLFILTVWGIPFISSCGKGKTVGPSSNTQYQVINLSPDLQAVDLYIDYIQRNASSFYYPTSSGYFILPSNDTPFQIRQARSLIPGAIISTANILSLDNILKSNTPYTLFIVGTKADSNINSVFVADTAASLTVGRGKLRFINASPGSTGFDVYANGTRAFQNAKYGVASKFIELSSGTYDLKIFPGNSTSTTTGQLLDIPNITILDGRLYNFYAYGLPTHTNDSLAFGANVLIVPAINK